jgi:hypothetical protein
MFYKKQLIHSFYLILTTCGLVQANQWNGIIPLESTRADVEKIIGKPEPISKNRYAASYTTKNERVFVIYSTGNCNNKPSNGWNVEKLKVISISVFPVTPTKLADHKFDESKFSRHIGDTRSLEEYTNETDGVGFVVNIPYKRIEEFDYFPKSKDRYLLCKRS